MRRLVVTGASGFIGRHLLDALKDDWQIVGLARRSQARSGAPVHPNITWHQADIADRAALVPIFDAIAAQGGADALVHLAAHYDFTGDEHPQYWRTNVDGLRNVLELSAPLGLKRFLFSSSVAACSFPPPGGALNEDSPPDGGHVYSRTKKIGEEMVAASGLPWTTVRFAALFSDWCEYAPLFMFLSTWLSSAWNRRILGGWGLSAIPYLHVEDAVGFLSLLLDTLDRVAPAQTLIASPDGATSHRDLFDAATLLYHGRRVEPVLMPRPLCGPGMWGRDLLGRLLGQRPFERPWMAEYIDLAMTIDGSRTRARLGWEPRPRLEVVRRLPFLVENLKTDPLTWYARNRAAMKEPQLGTNLLIHRLLQAHEREIAEEYTESLLGPHGRERFPSYQNLSADEHDWNHRVILRHLMNAVRTGEKAVLATFCRDLAERRYRQGYNPREVCDALSELNRVCFKVLRRDRETDGLQSEMRDHITTALQWGCDQAQDVFERLEAAQARKLRMAAREASSRMG